MMCPFPWRSRSMRLHDDEALRPAAEKVTAAEIHDATEGPQ